MSHRPILVSLIPAALIVGLWTAHAQPRKDSSPGPAALEKLSWLAGNWRQVDIDHPTEEHWGAPSKNAMLGMCRLGSDGETQTYELMVIEQRKGKLTYSLRHFGPGLADKDKEPMTFDVRIGEDHKVVFEGRDSKRPSRLNYSLTGPDTLSIVLERTRDGKSLHDEFHMNRIK